MKVHIVFLVNTRFYKYAIPDYHVIFRYVTKLLLLSGSLISNIKTQPSLKQLKKTNKRFFVQPSMEIDIKTLGPYKTTESSRDHNTFSKNEIEIAAWSNYA